MQMASAQIADWRPSEDIERDDDWLRAPLHTTWIAPDARRDPKQDPRPHEMWVLSFQLPIQLGTAVQTQTVRIVCPWAIPEDTFATLDSVLLCSKLSFGQHLQAPSWRDPGPLFQKDSDSLVMLTKL